MSTAGAVGLAENLKGNEIQLWRFVTSFLEKSLAMPAMSPSVLWKTENFGGTIAKISCQAKASCLEWAEEREKPGVAAQKQVEDGIWQSPATNRPLPVLSDGPRSAYRKQPLPLAFPTCRLPPAISLRKTTVDDWNRGFLFLILFLLTKRNNMKRGWAHENIYAQGNEPTEGLTGEIKGRTRITQQTKMYQ